jgi:hypothetical protein
MIIQLMDVCIVWMGVFADILEVYSASIFRVEVCRVSFCIYTYRSEFQKNGRGQEQGLVSSLG